MSRLALKAGTAFSGSATFAPLREYASPLAMPLRLRRARTALIVCVPLLSVPPVTSRHRAASASIDGAAPARVQASQIPHLD